MDRTDEDGFESWPGTYARKIEKPQWYRYNKVPVAVSIYAFIVLDE
jgi:hypothetical protein